MVAGIGRRAEYGLNFGDDFKLMKRVSGTNPERLSASSANLGHYIALVTTRLWTDMGISGWRHVIALEYVILQAWFELWDGSTVAVISR